jgi:DNA-binding transcriptional ArsR family regulator
LPGIIFVIGKPREYIFANKQGQQNAAPHNTLASAERVLDRCNHMPNYIDMKAEYSRQIPDMWRDIAKVFIALGHEHRQRILLTFDPGERLNVGQLVEISTLSRSAVSHHLKILHQAGALQSRKEGKEVYFWIDKARLTESLRSVVDYISSNA